MEQPSGALGETFPCFRACSHESRFQTRPNSFPSCRGSSSSARKNVAINWQSDRGRQSDDATWNYATEVVPRCRVDVCQKCISHIYPTLCDAKKWGIPSVECKLRTLTRAGRLYHSDAPIRSSPHLMSLLTAEGHCAQLHATICCTTRREADFPVNITLH